ncbi:hypothetical protein AVEN_184667-1, partial [Araneus ventricosus]
WEELYIAVLYTIKHKLGANSGGYSVYAEDLYEYAQEAFCMSDEDHKRFLSIAQDEKVSIKFWTTSINGKSVCLSVRGHANTITQKLE